MSAHRDAQGPSAENAPESRVDAVVSPVSVVIASLDDRDLLRRHLPPLLADLVRRNVGDEVIVVDDTGRGELAAWLAEQYPTSASAADSVSPSITVRPIARDANGGFARAMLTGVEAARHELVFLMNPDVRVHAGFLEPLIAALADPLVHSAVPRLLLFGAAKRIESVTGVRLRHDVAEVDQPGLAGRAEAYEHGVLPVTYAVGGAALLRRSEFLAIGGFDPLYEPFYYEDLDLGFAAWRAGRSVLYCADSVAEHHHRGTIRRRVDEKLVRAVIERNRYLFQWRFLDGEERLTRHLAALYRAALDAYLREDRDELVWLGLALEQLEALRSSRARLGPAARSFDEVLKASAPHSGGR